MPPDYLRPESLDWALTHVKRFGDTDIFPQIFEFEAIAAYWGPLRDYLSKVDLAVYEGRPFRRLFVPKPNSGFRAVVQLDPLDTLLYLAAIHEAAPLIEADRIPIENRVACAYRIKVDAKGQLFPNANGWGDFSAQSKKLTESGKYRYVLIADIADFYNQLGHHRIRNALEHAGVNPERARNLENYLMNLTRGQSKGIPVGPTPSIVLAEACLGDVDQFLLMKGYVHTRYVDDFRIFCPTRKDAIHALHDLSEYLYTAHRLALQSEKTKIKYTERFVKEDLLDPERVEEEAKTRKIGEIVEAIGGYGEIEDVDADDIDLNELAREILKELFEQCVKQSPLHMGLSRYVLRRAGQLRSNVLQTLTLQNIERLVPVMRDVCVYLIRATPAKEAAQVSKALVAYFDNGDFGFLPFVRLWIATFLLAKCPEDMRQDLMRITQELQKDFGVRQHALMAKQLGLLEWVRMQKETWQNNDPWTRRAIIWAASALTKDERNYWLKRVENAGDILDKAIANAALTAQ
jgi:reverse transcriptase-like protein